MSLPNFLGVINQENSFVKLWPLTNKDSAQNKVIVGPQVYGDIPLALSILLTLAKERAEIAKKKDKTKIQLLIHHIF